MAHFIPVLTILFGFIASGSSLRCIECTSTTPDFCKGKSHKCAPRSKSCITTLGIMTIGEEVHEFFSRRCNDDIHLCDQDFILNSGVGNKQTRFITRCCYTDDCNSCKKKAPPYNATMNGLICPVCYKNDSYVCESRGYIKCRGKETECIDFAATLHKEGSLNLKFSLLGCSTEGSCSLGPKIAPGTKIIDTKRLSCKNAVPITH